MAAVPDYFTSGGSQEEQLKIVLDCLTRDKDYGNQVPDVVLELE
ncbi:hypothetical protein [Candidatus Enterococcus ferrettii]|nr:hypothetical protein [Enterococcus sp. 665A]